MKRSCHHEQVIKSNMQSNYRMGKAMKTKTTIYRSSHPKVFLVEDVLKICSKFTGEHPCRSVISIKLRCNFIEVTLWHGCSPVNLLDIFSEHLFPRTPLDGCFGRPATPDQTFIGHLKICHWMTSSILVRFWQSQDFLNANIIRK